MTILLFFLATDSEEVVSVFEKAFGQRVVFQKDVSRVHATEGLTGPHDRQEPQTVLDGELILTDVLLLTRCNVFIHSVSNMATAVGYINPDIKMVYVYSWLGIGKMLVWKIRKLFSIP